MGEARLIADQNLGDGVPLQLPAAETAVAFKEIERGAVLDENDVAGDHARRLGRTIKMDEVDRLIEPRPFAHAQGGATAHEGEVECDHRIALLWVHLAER